MTLTKEHLLAALAGAALVAAGAAGALAGSDLRVERRAELLAAAAAAYAPALEPPPAPVPAMAAIEMPRMSDAGLDEDEVRLIARDEVLRAFLEVELTGVRPL